MTKKYKITPEQAKVLKELEKLIGKAIPIKERIEWNTFGVKVEGDKVTGIGIYRQGLSTLPESIGNLTTLQELNLKYNQLTTLPESIGDLKALQKLDIEHNKLTTLPESIGTLSSLQTIDLYGNELSTLPESIGNLTALHTLDLEFNQLTTLPESIGNLTTLQELTLGHNQLTTLSESIGNLTSLQRLDIASNQLLTLPGSLWKCKNLETLYLNGNTWEDKWKGIENYAIARVLELCRERASITVFASHSKKDKALSLISTLKENLKNRKEIYKVHDIGETEISESQLLIFVATKNSITDDQCMRELGLALTNDINIIPIKSTDLGWNELERIDLRKEGHGYYDLSDEKGIEFDSKEEKIEKSCDELYEYVKQYKRDFNLFEPEERKLDQQKKNVKIVFEKLIESEEFRENLKENFNKLKQIFTELRSEKISSREYIFRTGQIFKSNSK